jgi:hypothetical protein
MDEEEKERTWPWLDRVREDNAEATKDMTPQEKIVYYRGGLAQLRREQGHCPPGEQFDS